MLLVTVQIKVDRRGPDECDSMLGLAVAQNVRLGAKVAADIHHSNRGMCVASHSPAQYSVTSAVSE